MGKSDLLSIEGTVTEINGGTYRIQLDKGLAISARLSGRMKRFQIRVIVGDRVTVGVSPYDPTHGLITHRFRL